MHHTPSRKRASRMSAMSPIEQHRSGKRRQFTSPYVSQEACVICQDKSVQVVQLGACCHTVCRACMTSHLLHAFKLRQLPLRCPLPHCRACLALQQAVTLMEQQVPGSGKLAAQVLLAGADPLALMSRDLFTCPYLDCQVPMEPDAQLPDLPSDCPTCNRPVCGTCRSKWHSGLACAEYQALARPQRAATAFNCQLQQQPPLISAMPDSNGWQQQVLCSSGSAATQQQQCQQQQQGLVVMPLPSKINVGRVAAAGDGLQEEVGGSMRNSCDLQLGTAAASDQDDMSWSPAKRQ